MEPWLAVVLVGCLVAVAGTGASLLASRRRVRELTDENLRLHELVEARVERPQVFSHEVRTPLALISGAAELLAEQSPGPLNERQLEFVRTIATNARQVNGIAEDLLVEAQLAANLFTLRPAEVDLRALVRQTVREVRRIAETEISLVNQGPPILLEADPDLLRQAMWNLVNNAVRHAGEGVRVQVEVSLGEQEAIVHVGDDGEGMTPTEREHLFDAYVVGSSRRPGTGLGMMITQQVVQLHGGRILVETQPGQGTVIFVALPLVHSQEVRHG